MKAGKETRRTEAEEDVDAEYSMDVWNGLTRPETFSDRALRQELADSAKAHDWSRTIAIIRNNRGFGHPGLVNATRPGGTSWYAPLHQAAYGNAPLPVVTELIELGAWRSLLNGKGIRPVDVARQRGHHLLVPALTPQFKHDVPPDVLLKIQAHFHRVIAGRAARLIERHTLRLPELSPLLERERPEMWFPILGMSGGFFYRLEPDGAQTKLITESWSRVVGGSEQRHEVTLSGSRLLAEGYWPYG